ARRQKLTEIERNYLLYGIAPNPQPLTFQERNWGENARRCGILQWDDLWEGYRVALTAEYAAQHPGRRPEAWWCFDAPEPRQQLSGGGRPAWTVPESGIKRELTQRGVPLLWVDDDEQDPIFESEPAYLRRLGLLLDGELERIPAEAFEPDCFNKELRREDVL